jgi:hypothetical protein
MFNQIKKKKYLKNQSYVYAGPKKCSTENSF